MEIIRKIIKAFFHFLVIIVYRPKVIGQENVPKEGGAILCPNHVHAMDSVIVVTTNKRKVHFMAKEELFKNEFIKWLANVFGIFPVKRGGKDIDAIKTSLKVLKNGGLLNIFPEGTRNGLKKGLKPKNGATLIAAKAKVPIIPVGVQGSFKPFTKVKLNYGKPISTETLDVQDKEVVDAFTLKVMEEIVRLTNKKN